MSPGPGTGGDGLPGDVTRLPAGTLVVAVSGGLDSMVLLHQLRFVAGRGPDLRAVHVDHAMRSGSADDARWLRGVCRAWDVALEVHRLGSPPSSEEEARDARYRILEDGARRHGAAGIVLAHHADDQAETVLFRVLRGTGLAGLRGMAPRTGLRLRPLLPVWREELEDWAAAHRVPWREDRSNRDPAYARNVLRHEIIPRAEAGVAPGTRRALVRLAANAGAAAAELAAFDRALLDPLLREVAPGRVEFDADGAAALPGELRARLVRRGVRRLGLTLSRRATALALDALDRLHPGKGLDLTGGVRLERGMNRWILVHPGARPARPGSDPGSGSDPRSGDLSPADWELGPREARRPGSARVALGRWAYTIRWRLEDPGREGDLVAIHRGAHLPLRIRGWRPGDRIRTRAGSRPVAKLLAEAGVSALDRPAAAVAVDPGDRVLWVPGRARAVELAAAGAVGGGPSPADGQWLFLTCTRTLV